jgi:hypothetical protein
MPGSCQLIAATRLDRSTCQISLHTDRDFQFFLLRSFQRISLDSAALLTPVGGNQIRDDHTMEDEMIVMSLMRIESTSLTGNPYNAVEQMQETS